MDVIHGQDSYIFLKGTVIIVKARNIEFQDMLCLTWKTENIYV